MKWALVLSGGGAKGLAYIGLLKVFEELNIPKPSLIVGCSIGALIGGLYALGKTSDEIEKIFTINFDQKNYFGGGNALNVKVVDKVLDFGIAFSNIISGNSLDDGSKFYGFLKNITDKKGFDDVKIPFVCNALDLNHGREVILQKGELAKSIMASCAYPVLFSPVRIEEKFLVDGGMSNNTPVWIAKSFGFKNIVSVTLDHFRVLTFPYKYTDVAFIFIRLMACILENNGLRKIDYPSFWIDLSNDINSDDFSNTLSKIILGYKLSLKQKDYIKKYFSVGVESSIFRRKIKSYVKKVYRV